MAKLLLGISLFLILVTGGLSFVTKGKVEALQGDLKDTKGTLSTTKTTLSKTEGTLKTTQGDLTTAKGTIEENEKEIVKQKGIARDASEAAATAKADAETKAASVAALTAELDAIKVKLAGDPSKPPVDIDQLKADLAKAITDREEAVQVQKTLETQKQAATDKLAGVERTVAEYKSGFVRNGLSGQVLAYNPGWNFVVLSIGDKAGLKANAQLVVMRGNQSIAKVKVTSVEPSSSIADILPGSLTKGSSVQPGDTVVYEAKR